MVRDDRLRDDLVAGLEAQLQGPVETGVVDQLLEYLRLLVRWNKTYNLTAIRDPREMLSRHVFDSLSVLPWIEQGSLLDAGTGAGLPGIPLAIIRPGLEATLLDSAGKKIRFLNHVVRELKLKNVHPVQARLESWDSDQSYQWIVSRAFANAGEFASMATHLAGPDTRLLAMKGKRPDAELDDLPAGWQVDSIEQLQVAGLQEERHLVMMSFNPHHTETNSREV